MKEPWIRVVKKAELGKRETLILRLEAIVLALVAGGFFILLIGQNPFVIYQTIVTGALRSEMAIQATVKIMIPLLIASLGVTLAFKNEILEHWSRGTDHYGRYFCLVFCTVPCELESLAAGDRDVSGRRDRRRSVGTHSGVV